MKIGTIKSRCSSLRNLCILAFFIINGLKLFNSILAANEVTEFEHIHSEHIHLLTSLHHAEAHHYPYSNHHHPTPHAPLSCDSCNSFKERDGSPLKFYCDSCSNHVSVKLQDIIDTERDSMLKRIKFELLNSSENRTKSINLFEFFSWNVIGGTDKLDLYSNPKSMRSQLLWEQSFNLLGGLMGVYNFFRFIQSLLVRQSHHRKSPGETQREGFDDSALSITGDPMETARNNATLRHRSRSGWWNSSE